MNIYINSKECNIKFIEDLLLVVKTFIEENKTVTYSRMNSLEYTLKYINDRTTEIFLAYADDEIAGMSILAYDNEWHEERFGYITKFYVMPKFRGTKVGRELVSMSTQYFDEENCIKSYATATGGVNEDKQFVNLLSKYGYRNTGFALERNNNGKV